MTEQKKKILFLDLAKKKHEAMIPSDATCELRIWNDREDGGVQTLVVSLKGHQIAAWSGISSFFDPSLVDLTLPGSKEFL